MATKPEVDLSTLTPEEKQMYEKYGRLPQKGAFAKKLMKGSNKPQRFDSADFEMQKKQGGRGNPLLARRGMAPRTGLAGRGNKPPIPADVKAEAAKADDGDSKAEATEAKAE